MVNFLGYVNTNALDWYTLNTIVSDINRLEAEKRFHGGNPDLYRNFERLEYDGQ